MFEHRVESGKWRFVWGEWGGSYYLVEHIDRRCSCFGSISEAERGELRRRYKWPLGLQHRHRQRSTESIWGKDSIGLSSLCLFSLTSLQSSTDAQPNNTEDS